MARRRKSSFWKSFFGGNSKDSYSGLILGAIIVVVLGLLVANYFSKRNMLPATNQQESSQVQENKAQINNGANVQGQEYKVVGSDSLSAIAMKYYGSYDYWPVLVKANKIANPNIIYKDATLKIPAKDEAEKMRIELSATSYEVQQGDTLFTIAEKVYGNGYKWTLLDKANKVGRLANGNPLIFSGSKLVIPR